MIIDLIRAPRKAARIGSLQALENDRLTVRRDQSRPKQDYARLAVATSLSYAPMRRAPCGTSRMRPEGVSRTFSVT